MIDKLGSPETYNHYPTGWAVGVLDAVPDVQALLVPGRRLRPARHPLAGGDQGARRGPHPVPPLHRHRPDDPRLLRRRDARRRRRLRADAAARRLDALLVRRRRRADARRRRSTTRCSARAASGTRAGRRSPSTGRSRSTSGSSTRTAGSSSTPTRTAPRRTTSPSSTPRSSRSSRRCGSRRRRSTTCCRSTTSAIFEFRDARVRDRRCRRAGSTRTTRARARSPRRRRRGRPTPRTRSSPRSSSRRTRQGVIVAQGSRFGGFSLFVKDGKLTYVVQLPRHPARAADRRRRADLRHAHRRRRVHEGARWASTTSRTGR